MSHVRGLALAFDRRPGLALLGLWVLLVVGLEVWSALADRPILIAGLSAPQRLALFGQLSGSATALLAAALTVLSILVALPDRPRVKLLRDSNGWRLLQTGLLTAALLCLITVIATHLATATEGGQRPVEWLVQLVLASAVTAALAVTVGGTAFALVLTAINRPPQTTPGRGEPDSGAR